VKALSERAAVIERRGCCSKEMKVGWCRSCVGKCYRSSLPHQRIFSQDYDARIPNLMDVKEAEVTTIQIDIVENKAAFTMSRCTVLYS